MKDFFDIGIKLFQNKYLSFNVGQYTTKTEKTNLFNFNIKCTRRIDHAGFIFDIEICNLYSYFNIYDNRHWCESCNGWQCDKHTEVEE